MSYGRVYWEALQAADGTQPVLGGILWDDLADDVQAAHDAAAVKLIEQHDRELLAHFTALGRQLSPFARMAADTVKAIIIHWAGVKR